MMSGSVLEGNLLPRRPGFYSSIPVSSSGTFSFSNGLTPPARPEHKHLVRYSENQSTHPYPPDRAVMDLAFEGVCIKIECLDPHFYAARPSEAPPGADIQHAFHPEKFWIGVNFDEWNLDYEEWPPRGQPRISPLGRGRGIKRLLVKFGFWVRKSSRPSEQKMSGCFTQRTRIQKKSEAKHVP